MMPFGTIGPSALFKGTGVKPKNRVKLMTALLCDCLYWEDVYAKPYTTSGLTTIFGASMLPNPAFGRILIR